MHQPALTGQKSNALKGSLDSKASLGKSSAGLSQLSFTSVSPRQKRDPSPAELGFLRSQSSAHQVKELRRTHQAS